MIDIEINFEKMEDIGTGMTNFDHSIDPGFEEMLKSKPCFGRYAGWDFNGKVAFDWKSGKFVCEVWVYGVPQEIIKCQTLEEIMSEVSDKYGEG